MSKKEKNGRTPPSVPRRMGDPSRTPAGQRSSASTARPPPDAPLQAARRRQDLRGSDRSRRPTGITVSTELAAPTPANVTAKISKNNR